MRQISSNQTFWLKRVFPVLWFGLITVFMGIVIIASANSKAAAPPVFVLAVPVLMMGVGYVLFRHLLFDLADKVFDTGDALEVHKAGQVVRVPLADLINVDSAPFVNPPRIVLTLRTETALGRKIAFSPKRPFSLNPFASNPIADELIDRIDQARRGRR